MSIYDFLKEHDISYEETKHVAVFTCEQAEEHVSDMEGFHTKNLFLRDKKGNKHYLVVVGYEKSVDLKALAALLGESKLSFGSPERLMKYLQLEPGSVTILGIINDPDHEVEVILDKAMWEADMVLSHPLINTATLSIAHEGIEKFLSETGHEFKVIDIPARD
ncbi:MAG: prolyl-tRNA synthetase associated domain-containing protein [Candidatus Peribacteraceae bacterium]|jgi:Ala-tRNA(Pro) deacylase|nr:prolyl-tRNA synthetase associated domain-containing protein [Candidatus Peribacteraceae bacterium]